MALVRTQTADHRVAAVGYLGFVPSPHPHSQVHHCPGRAETLHHYFKTPMVSQTDEATETQHLHSKMSLVLVTFHSGVISRCTHTHTHTQTNKQTNK